MRGGGNVRVMEQVLGREGFSVVSATDRNELDDALADGGQGILALVDIAGFGPAVWDMCRILQERGVRFVVLSAAQQNSIGSEAFRHGAANFLQKPVGKAALVQLLRTLAN